MTMTISHDETCTAGCHNQGHCAPDCFGCKAQSVTMSQAAMPTRKPGVVAGVRTERDYVRDNPAYRRLRREGLQPKTPAGAAALEARAVSRFEIESGHDLKGNARAGRRADEVNDAIKAGKIADL